jgi:hypothetical protein
VDLMVAKRVSSPSQGVKAPGGKVRPGYSFIFRTPGRKPQSNTTYVIAARAIEIDACYNGRDFPFSPSRRCCPAWFDSGDRSRCQRLRHAHTAVELVQIEVPVIDQGPYRSLAYNRRVEGIHLQDAGNRPLKVRTLSHGNVRMQHPGRHPPSVDPRENL